jgi:transposase
MSREQRSIRLTHQQRLALQRATRQRGEAGVALRATIILLSAQGQSATGIAQTLGLTARTVYQWRRRWRQHGLRGLADAPRQGRPRQVGPTYLQMLLRTVESDPRQLDFAFTRWTCSRLAEYLRQRTGVAVSPDWVGKLLRRHGYVWRRAKPTTRNLREEGEKTTRRPSPQGPAHSEFPPGRPVRAVVRGWSALRPAAGDTCHVETQGPAPAAAHAR